MYPTEADIRPLLSWLTQQAKPATTTTTEDQTYDSSSVNRRIAEALTQLTTSTWTKQPFLKFAKENPHRPPQKRLTTKNVHLVQGQTEYETLYGRVFASDATEQAAKDTPASVIEDNAKELIAARLKEELYADDQTLSRNEFFTKRLKELMRQVGHVISQPYNDKFDMVSVSDLLSQTRIYGDQTVSSNFVNRVKFETESTAQVPTHIVTDEEKEKQRQEELEKLNAALEKLTNALDTIHTEIQRFTQAIRSTEEQINSEKNKKKELEEKFRVDAQVEVLLRDENKIKEIEKIGEQSKERLLQLGREWERHRRAFVDKIRQIKYNMNVKQGEARDQLARAKRNREEMKRLIHEVKEKEELIARMKKEIEEMPKEMQRGDYLTRIMDIARSVDKQREEINKILLENADLNKEILSISDTLSRTFRETEESVYREAQKGDESSKQSYRLLLEMRSLFEHLIQSVTETGQALNSIRDLDNKIEALQKSKDKENLERLGGDLTSIKKENEQLAYQLSQLM